MSTRLPTPDIIGDILSLAGPPAPTPLPLAAIVNDGGTQMRAGMNADTVKEYEDALADAEAWPFPPVIVFHDGARYWLADGFHRLNAAHRSNKFEQIPADIKPGTRRDAVLFAAGANASHGLRRTNEDKRRAVEVLLRDEEWSQWSDEDIARRCAVGRNFVTKVRSEISPSCTPSASQPIYRTVIRNGKPMQMNVAAIGNREKSRPLTNEEHHFLTRAPQPSIYVLEHNGRCKIGWSRTPISRVSELLTQNPDAKISIVASGEIRDERRIHGELQCERDIGEWFICSPTDVIQAMAKCGIEPIIFDDVRANRETLRNDLDQELTDALLRYYWSAAELNNFAQSATPFEDCRRRLVSSGRGMATGTWRIDSHHGKVYAWHVSRGKAYFDREPDAIFTYDRFARMTLGLPEAQQARPAAAAIAQTVADVVEVHGDAASSAPLAPRPSPLEPVSQRADYESDEWYTPAEYIDAAKAVMGAIDLDPASSEMAQTVVRAGVYLTRFDDGLNQTRWIHQRIWLNPPYSNPGPWIEKLVREHQAGPFCTEAIVLVNNATETSWFQLLLERFPVCLPARRLAFWRHDHANVGARQGQAFFYFGPNDDRFEEVFRQFGPILRRVS